MKSKLLILLSLFAFVGGVKAETVTTKLTAPKNNNPVQTVSWTDRYCTFELSGGNLGYSETNDCFVLSPSTTYILTWSFNADKGMYNFDGISAATASSRIVRQGILGIVTDHPIKYETSFGKFVNGKNYSAFGTVTIPIEERLMESGSITITTSDKNGGSNAGSSTYYLKELELTYSVSLKGNAEDINKDNVYLYTNIEGKQTALGFGAQWNTQATLTNDAASKVSISTDNGNSQVLFSEGNYLYDAGNYNLFTDRNTANNFIFVSENGGYKIFLSTDLRYAIGDDTENIDGNDHVVMKLKLANDADIFYIGNYKAELSCKASKFGTFVAPFDVTLPENVTSFIVTGVNDKGEIVMIENGASVSANTPVLLENTEDALATETYYGNNSSADDVSANGNLLVGLLNSHQVSAGYVLQTPSDGTDQRFFKVASPLTLAANRCYLNYTKPSSVKELFLNAGEATAIDAIEALTNGNAQIFDINGRKLDRLQKGINIVNGKKVLVK